MNRSFYLQLVNPWHPAMEIPDPSQLAAPHPDYPDILMESRAAQALKSLLARLDAFDRIVPVSGFRSHQQQQKIWDDSMKENGYLFTRQYVAIPGCSEHETGLAIDLAANAPDIDFIRRISLYGHLRSIPRPCSILWIYPPVSRRKGIHHPYI